MRISEPQRVTWDRDGWLALPGAIDADTIAALIESVGELERWADAGGPGMHHFEMTDHGPALARSERFADEHPALESFLRDGTHVELLGELFGEPAVLFKEKVNHKQPGGAGFAAHQDAAAYRFADHHISVMVPLDDATIESGCLWFARGHTAGRLETDEGGRLTDSVVESLDWEPLEVRPGDLVTFDSYAPHRSDKNRSAHPRRALYVTYNAASQGDLRARYYADKDAEFAAGGDAFASGSLRISISDDFLGRPVR